MLEATNQLLFALLRSAFFGEAMSESEKALFSEEDLQNLLVIAKKHDILHLIGKALMDNSLIGEDNKYYAVTQKAQVLAVYRYEQLKYELGRICEALEKAAIHFLPLKGSVLRAYYPEPWMRTSCDIDVLVHKEDLEKAVSCFVEELGYTETQRTSRDVIFDTETGRHIELHFDLLNEDEANGARDILLNIWDYACAKEGYTYLYVLSDEMFYFYHIAHMAKHFEHGGCGIRSFVDVWVLDNRIGFSLEKRDELLKSGGLFAFAEGARRLSRVWLECAEADELSALMENYLIFGGAYGTFANRVTVQQHKKGGKKGYALSRIFMSTDAMKENYTYLQKCPWLLPVAHVHRWLRVVFRGNAANSLKELKVNSDVTAEQSDDAKQMLEQLGLL